MHICMVTSAPFPPREGQGVYIWNLSRYLIQHGHQVSIITRGDRRLYQQNSQDGICIHRPFFVPVYPIHVHLHGLYVSKLVRSIEQKVDLFHSHSPLVPPLRTARPVMVSFHSPVREDIKATKLANWQTLLMKLQAPISFRLEVENLRAASTVNAVSPRVAQALQNYPACPPDVPVVWNGVDTEFFQPIPVAVADGDYILSVGRIGPGKGLEDLLTALSLITQRTKPPKLVIVGDGPLSNSLKKRVQESGLGDSVHFAGHISDREQLKQYYQRAALFVLPSHHEGLPTVVLEAMACGCPVLATDVGGIPSVIQDRINGMIVPLRAPQQLAAGIQTLLADPVKRCEMGIRARQTIVQQFSWERIGARFVNLYSECIAYRRNRFAS